MSPTFEIPLSSRNIGFKKGKEQKNQNTNQNQTHDTLCWLTKQDGEEVEEQGGKKSRYRFSPSLD